MVVPSTPYDAKGLLLESIFDDSPVLFFEHLKLYVSKGPVPEEPYRIPLGVAEVRRTGSDVTVVAISAMVDRALEAAELLAAEGIERRGDRPAHALAARRGDDHRARSRRPARSSSSTRARRTAASPRRSLPSCPSRAFDFLNGPVRRVTAPHAPVPVHPVARGRLCAVGAGDRRRGATLCVTVERAEL